MPYISPSRAKALDQGGMMLYSADLAYILSGEIARYMRPVELSYQRITEVRGALAAASWEFERRVAIPYEQGKLEGGGADPYEQLSDEANEALCKGLLSQLADANTRS